MANITIFDDLKRDHDLHRQLIKDIRAAKQDRDRRIDLFEHFKVEVTAHAAAEEETLYATMLARPDLREEAQHSVAEHKEIGDLLEALDGGDVTSDEWTGVFDRLRKRYLHHIDEEEAEMFPNAAADLTATEEKALAAKFEKRKPAELERALKS
jgi:hemerythrin superfamily protein